MKRILLPILAMGILLLRACAAPSAPSPAPTPNVTKEASELVLTLDDFGPGWVLHDSHPSDKKGAESAHHVYFREDILYYPGVVQNTVAVYSTTELAHQAYLEEKPENVSVENPKIGDESFLRTQLVQEQLVFRKSNVVVWIWLQQSPPLDIRSCAQWVESKLYR